MSKINAGTGRSLPGKEQFKLRLFYWLTVLSPRLSTIVQYRAANGCMPDLRHPETFAEKLSWLKLNSYADNALVSQCADKLRVRDYVRECGCGEFLNELYAVYDSPEEIVWELLPKQYVLKWNFGCGFNILCDGSDSFDRKEAMRRLRVWQKIKYWNFHGEMQYRGIEPKILCERFLDVPSGDDLIDYKFYAFSGKVKAILVIARKAGQAECAVFMTPEWEYLSDIPSRYFASFYPERPPSLAQMLEASEKMAVPFPFVRVDFYEFEGKPVFGELTFTPAAALNPSECKIEGKTMGEWLVLPDA